MRLLCATLLAASLASTGCQRSDGPPNGPAPSLAPLTGTWSGDLAVLGAPARMTWTLTQNGSTVTGPARVLLPTGIVLLNGALTGTLSGTAFAYTITVSPGGVPTQPGCTGQLAGNTVASIGTTSTMAGDYTVTSSTCPTPLSAGTFTLTKSS